MNTTLLLSQLYRRLATIQYRLNTVITVKPAEAGYLYAAGQLMELRNEKLFLLTLIEQMTGTGDL